MPSLNNHNLANNMRHTVTQTSQVQANCQRWMLSRTWLDWRKQALTVTGERTKTGKLDFFKATNIHLQFDSKTNFPAMTPHNYQNWRLASNSAKQIFVNTSNGKWANLKYFNLCSRNIRGLDRQVWYNIGGLHWYPEF